MLLYTLKKHKRKLKKRVLGPFVINELTSSGAVRLETLDGAQMPNFINGSRLKKYEEPLTEYMLQQLHQAKTYKEGQQRLKELAEQEARKRRQRMKTRHQANVLSLSVNGDDEGDDFSVQPFTIKMDLVIATHQLSSSALIDLGADCNV